MTDLPPHDHGQGWPMCVCGIRFPGGCPRCEPTHRALHHRHRRQRAVKEGSSEWDLTAAPLRPIVPINGSIEPTNGRKNPR